MKFSTQEKINVALLISLYFVQGLLIAFPIRTLVNILVKQGTQIQDLSILAFAAVPFTIKILWAPFLDIYYIKSIGKRKTYIVPIFYFLIVSQILMGNQLQELIETQQIFIISVWGLVTIFLCAIQDVAIDGWVSNLFDTEENQSYASSCQTMGQHAGWFCSEHLFIWLYSQDMVSIQTYFIGVSIIILGLNLYVHFVKKEQSQNDIQSLNSQQTVQVKSVKDLFFLLSKFYTNKNLRTLSIIFLIYRLGFSPLDTAGYLLLIKKGFSQQQWAQFGIILFPLQIIIPFLTGKYLTGLNKEMYFFKLFIFFKTIDSLIFTLTINLYDEQYEKSSIFYYILFLNYGFQQICNIGIFVITGSFVFKIQDQQAGGTFVTMLFSLLNCGKYMAEPISLILIGLFPFIVLSLIGIVYSCWFLKYFQDDFVILDQFHVNKFSITRGEKDKDQEYSQELQQL